VPRAKKAGRLCGLARRILDRLCLVEDDVVEFDVGEEVRFPAQERIGGEYDVVLREVIGGANPVGRGMVEHAQFGSEARRLGLPIENDRARDDDERWPVFIVSCAALIEECQHLDGLAEPHVVRKTAAEAEVAQEREPA
jgi:hypothetical protein